MLEGMCQLVETDRLPNEEIRQQMGVKKGACTKIEEKQLK